MTNLLIRWFIKDYENTRNQSVARKYGYLCGFVGIATNTLLAVVKIFMGLAINSIAVTADAVNNLSDIGASVVTIIGFYYAGKPADEEHPFGHGRAEYLSALLLSLMVIFVGLQFLKSSWERITNPQPIESSLMSMGLLALAILLKVWQSGLYKKVGNKINSKTLIAASLDSLSDVGATSIVLLSLVLAKFITFPLDGYIGLMLSVLVIYNGWNIIKDVIDPILGSAPDEEQCKEITDLLLSCDGIRGCHDLIVHNYGAGSILATVHAEVSDKLELIEAHEIIDAAEKRIEEELGIGVLIHLDPINFDDPEIKNIYDETKKFVREIHSSINIHDFRMVHKIDNELIFDMVVPVDFSENMIEDIKGRTIKFLHENHQIGKVFIKIERGNIII